jgi:DNA-binding HxlR family transcriptional regulator
MKWQDVGNMNCSVARALSVLGDRWTLLVVRNAFLGTRRFDDFQASLGMTRHVLADRLGRLVEAGVLAKVAYQERPVRHEYRLTVKGRDLYPVLLSLSTWGDKWLDEGRGAPVEYHHKPCGKKTRPVLVCSECGEKLEASDVTPLAGPGLPPRRDARGP